MNWKLAVLGSLPVAADHAAARRGTVRDANPPPDHPPNGGPPGGRYLPSPDEVRLLRRLCAGGVAVDHERMQAYQAWEEKEIPTPDKFLPVWPDRIGVPCPPVAPMPREAKPKPKA